MDVGGLQGLLAVANRDGHEKAQRLEGEVSVCLCVATVLVFMTSQ